MQVAAWIVLAACRFETFASIEYVKQIKAKLQENARRRIDLQQKPKYIENACRLLPTFTIALQWQTAPLAN